MVRKRSFKKKANSKKYIKKNRKKTKSYKRTKTKGGSSFISRILRRSQNRSKQPTVNKPKNPAHFFEQPGFYREFRIYIMAYFKFITFINETQTVLANKLPYENYRTEYLEKIEKGIEQSEKMTQFIYDLISDTYYQETIIEYKINLQLRDELLYKEQLFLIIFFGLLNTYEIPDSIFNKTNPGTSVNENCSNHLTRLNLHNLKKKYVYKDCIYEIGDDESKTIRVYTTSEDPNQIENPVYIRFENDKYYFAINLKEISSKEMSSETQRKNYLFFSLPFLEAPPDVNVNEAARGDFVEE